MTTLMYLSFHAWLMILVGLVAAFWGIGLGALRNATLPKSQDRRAQTVAHMKALSEEITQSFRVLLDQ